MVSAWQRIAAGLRLPSAALTALVATWALLLFLAPIIDDDAVNVLCVLVGLVVSAVGLRALLAASQPFDIGPLTVPLLTTSRRLGGFYVVVGVLYASSFLARV